MGGGFNVFIKHAVALTGDRPAVGEIGSLLASRQGFRNDSPIGCYVNAAVQCLTRLPPIRDLLNGKLNVYLVLCIKFFIWHLLNRSFIDVTFADKCCLFNAYKHAFVLFPSCIPLKSKTAPVPSREVWTQD